MKILSKLHRYSLKKKLVKAKIGLVTSSNILHNNRSYSIIIIVLANGIKSQYLNRQIIMDGSH